MTSGRHHFGAFSLDPVERRLFTGNSLVDLNTRYFDALLLFLNNPGVLISKDHFLKEVWRGVPVTDEVLTQCIKTLRRQLGDNASSPHLIETVPKHGYRFIAEVTWVETEAASSSARKKAAEGEESPKQRHAFSWQQFWRIAGAGATGGGIAGLCGGLFFGLVAAGQTQQSGMGTLSTMLVLVALTTLVSLVGAAGVSFGIAASGFISGHFKYWSILGGAFGGLIIGTLGKMVGLDAFLLLLGNAPGDITGALEGLLLGGAVGCSYGLVTRYAGAEQLKYGAGIAGLGGAIAGILVTLLDGHLMSGSLSQLAGSFPDSRLHLDPFGDLMGSLGEIVTNTLEGALFGACIVGAIVLSER